ncbi:hypothetical protein G3567_10005 [Psychroflexus sp. YR1-1]|uniref:Uncharacterized protein n=1 Tax=Psychroflexus aurantiacus TaxID=2709310 RepID=A0A6B3RAE8_9FLAO|nr:hypothetical protein [Psychroflexus aurantiacus]NEV94474.1 hypothetical protein [Psychroflexus aurantiacus]
MKTITVLLIGLQLFFNHTFAQAEANIQALEVIENRTEMNGIYFHYKIKNTAATVIPAGSYETFYKENHEFLNYTLEIKMQDSNPANNTLKGQSIR